MHNSNFNKELQKKIESLHVDIIQFVDISNLSFNQNQGYTNAIIIGKILSKSYIKKVLTTENYVEIIKKNNNINSDEFHNTEIETDKIADTIAKFITQKGFDAYSQSEQNLLNSNKYNAKKKLSPLPHKTVAVLAGLGWIGKHNLLVTKQFGSAISFCTVLTNANIKTTNASLLESQCGKCKACVEICKSNSLKNKNWTPKINRDDILDVFSCTTCLMCMMICPWTKKYLYKKD